MGRLRVVLGDLRHATIGRHSAYLPVGIGYLASYATATYGAEALDFSLHSDVEEIIQVIDNESVDVIGLTNYCWNAELSREVMAYAKSLNRNVVSIGGGPEFPEAADEVSDYMNYREETDFFVIQEGEVAFTTLIGKILEESSLRSLKSDPFPGVYSLHADDKSLLFAPPHLRLTDLDVIPSPYLSGMFDKFLDGTYMPFLESQRGCPYSCTFCHEGAEWRNKVNGFSLERIKSELDYITVRMKDFRDVPLALADSNFGMFQRDEEIAEYIRYLEEEYGWPVSFIFDTGKSQLERLVRVATKMKRRISMSISPQSLNQDTLKAIKRKNLGHDNVESVYSAMEDVGITTNAGIIVPLPEETKDSFFDGLRRLSNSNVEQPLPYTAMMLKGTELASKDNRSRYGLKTRYRLVPREFGEYFGKRVFEIEELCIETNTMSYEDYIDCRAFVFIFTTYSHKQFDILRRHTKELGIDRFDFFMKVREKYQQRAVPPELSDVYADYVALTDQETFATPAQLREFYSQDENFEKLLTGRIGDNLIRNFMPKIILDHTDDALKVAYESLIELVEENPNEAITSSLRDACKWAQATRFVGPLLRLEQEAFSPIALTLEHDVDSWYLSEGKPLTSFRTPVEYTIEASRDRIGKSVEIWKTLYGSDYQLWTSRLLEGPTTFPEVWRQCRRTDRATAAIG